MRALPMMMMACAAAWIGVAGTLPAATPAQPGASSSASETPRLPGDDPPPRAMLMHPPPTPSPGNPPPPERGTDAPGPPLALALDAAQAALAACAADGYKVGVTVVDSVGQPRAAMTEDGARGGHIYNAVRKALAALEFKTPTSQVSARLDSDPAIVARVQPGMMPWAGAVPIERHGQVIGAIGVSGASSVQDEKCARAGLRKIESRLK